jgi:hypothetical protein
MTYDYAISPHAGARQLVSEGTTHSDDAISRGQGPPIELIVPAHFQISTGIAMVIRHPGIPAADARQLGEEVGLHHVGLHDIRCAPGDNPAKLNNNIRVKTKTF